VRAVHHPIGHSESPGTSLDGSLFGPGNRCFACSPDHPHGFRLRFQVSGDEVVTRFVPEGTHEGAPGVMHGGLVTLVADEVACWALIALRGKFGFTGTMNSRFPRPVRIGRELEARARIQTANERMPSVEVRLLQEEAVCFTSTMSFVVLDQAGAEKMLGGPLPEGWKRYFR
jgi:acyl-coenzyme A thioesterase PaaI-like protein